MKPLGVAPSTCAKRRNAPEILPWWENINNTISGSDGISYVDSIMKSIDLEYERETNILSY